MDVNIFREIDEVKVWFLALENEDEIRVRLRSKELVINDIAAEFGGGGHPLASGVRVKDLNELDTLIRSEEHTSELQSRFDLVCRLLLERTKEELRTL